MAEIESIVRTTMGEIEKMLNTKTVVGDPIMVDGKTLIPLISVGFGFGAGAGSGKTMTKESQEGTGGGTGGGGGIRPVAVIISDESGVRIESIKGSMAAAMEKAVEAGMQMVSRRMGGRNSSGEQPRENETYEGGGG